MDLLTNDLLGELLFLFKELFLEIIYLVSCLFPLKVFFSSEELHFSFNKLSGEFSWSTRNFNSLKRLILASCNCGAKFLVELIILLLQLLDIVFNKFLSELPIFIRNHRSLEALAISWYNFSSWISCSLRNLTQLIMFHFSWNSFRGTVELNFFT